MPRERGNDPKAAAVMAGGTMPWPSQSYSNICKEVLRETQLDKMRK